jgi:hypothetical protein
VLQESGINSKDIKERNSVKKPNLVATKRMHVLRAKAFFVLVKGQRPDLVTLSFDCQKNLPLPKLPDQMVYDSCQLYLYNFTIVEGSSTEKLSPVRVYSYCWAEDEFAKGSNQIASALYDRLMETNLTNKKTVRLIADGRGGQNKNSTVIGMCCLWLMSTPKHSEVIELVFSIAGRPFIPPGRVFGNIEKEVRHMEVIIDPKEYTNIKEIMQQWLCYKVIVRYLTRNRQ